MNGFARAMGCSRESRRTRTSSRPRDGEIFQDDHLHPGGIWLILAGRKKEQRSRMLKGRSGTRGRSAMGSRIEGQSRARGPQGRSESAICKRHRIKPAEYRRWRKPIPSQHRAAARAAPLPFSRSPAYRNVAKGLGGERQGAARCQELIEALPIPVFFKARDGKHLGANRAGKPTSASTARSSSARR